MKYWYSHKCIYRTLPLKLLVVLVTLIGTVSGLSDGIFRGVKYPTKLYSTQKNVQAYTKIHKALNTYSRRLASDDDSVYYGECSTDTRTNEANCQGTWTQVVPVVDQKGKCSLNIHYTKEKCEKYKGTWTKGSWAFSKESSTLEFVINIGISVILVMLSGLFSGLTLGLLGLDITGLEYIINGDPGSEDAKNAKVIYPLRKNGNYLLCTLLLGNVAVNAMLSILLAEITGGFMGFIVSTAVIVIFGEIIPQATCSRYALYIGAKTVPLVRIIMCLMFPLAKPIAMALDKVLGDEIGTIHTREQLREVLKHHELQSVLQRDEAEVLSGALSYHDKKVLEVMTPIDDVFMLPESQRLDFQTISDVFRNGYSRIPVYSDKDPNVYRGLLFTKDLILIDPEDEIPVRNLIQFFSRPLLRVHDDDTLGKVLGLFKSSQSHLALVLTPHHPEDGKDSYYTTNGIITLEDIIEEILQDEIVDETDMYKTLGKGKKQNESRKLFDIAQLRMFDSATTPNTSVKGNGLSAVEIQVIATHLINNIEQFRDAKIVKQKGNQNDLLVEGIKPTLDAVKKLVSISKVLRFSANAQEFTSPRGRSGQEIKTISDSTKRRLYIRGRCDNYCTLILSGKVLVHAGNENYQSKLGKFDMMAKPVLLAAHNSYIPDFSATADGGETCEVLRISSSDFQRIILNAPPSPRSSREKSRERIRHERKSSASTGSFNKYQVTNNLEAHDRDPSGSMSGDIQMQNLSSKRDNQKNNQ